MVLHKSVPEIHDLSILLLRQKMQVHIVYALEVVFAILRLQDLADLWSPDAQFQSPEVVSIHRGIESQLRHVPYELRDLEVIPVRLGLMLKMVAA